jgi:hypothetical protein
LKRLCRNPLKNKDYGIAAALALRLHFLRSP